MIQENEAPILNKAVDLQPRDDRPIFVTAEDIATGKLEGGFRGKPIERLLVLNAAWIAGGGPLTQLTEVLQESQRISQAARIPIAYVGTPLNSIEELGIMTASTIPNVTTTRDRYTAAKEAMTQAFYDIATNTDEKTVGIASIGYTAYGPWAVKEALLETERLTGKKISAVLANYDSSYPDTDQPSNNLDDYGIPTDRFNPKAYQSSSSTRVFQMICNPLPLKADIGKRAPEGTLCVAASMPFSQETIEGLRMVRDTEKSSARNNLALLLQTKTVDPRVVFALSDPDTIFVPFIASNGYFDRSSVGNWMTGMQYYDMIDALTLITESLDLYASSYGKRVLLTGETLFVKMAKDLQASRVIDVAGYSTDSPKGVYVGVKPPLSREEHILYMKSADIALQRTTQTNSFMEAALCGIPNITITAPAEGYMDAELMDNILLENGCPQFSSRTIGFYNLSPIIAKIIENVDGLRDITIANQDSFINDVYTNPGRNFYSILEYIFGLKNKK